MRTKPGLSDVSAVQVRHGQAVDSCAETQAECPVSGVTSYGGVWMKVRESDAQSVDFLFGLWRKDWVVASRLAAAETD